MFVKENADRKKKYHREDYMKRFCEFLRKHAKNIIDLKKNVAFDKKRTKITTICNRILHLQKKNYKKVYKR